MFHPRFNPRFEATKGRWPETEGMTTTDYLLNGILVFSIVRQLRGKRLAGINMFIPFVVAGQVMRTFLAKNGLLNHVLIGTGIIEPLGAQSMLDWRGIVVAFVWKQAPFVTLLLGT